MQLTEFSTQLEFADNEKKARQLLEQFLASFGFRAFAFTYYSGHVKTGRKLRYQFSSRALMPWHVYYIEQGYADVDRTLEENYHMTIPLFWDVQVQLRNAKNKREKRIRKESIKFGINKGMSIPVHGPNHDFATLTLHQFIGEKSLENSAKQQFIWLSATHLFYHHIKRILQLDSKTTSSYHLTRRESQCLELTAKAWRVEKIAKELKISARTVNFHLQNVNKKIGTNNKYQAVLKFFNT